MAGLWKLKLRSWLVTVLMFAIVYFIIMIAGSLLGFGGFYQFYFFSGIFVLILQYVFGPKIVERSMGVRYLSEEEAPHIHKMVEELAIAANIPKPKVGISPTMVPNAFAYGRSKRSGHVCVTQGILNTLNRDELKAVLGHEISHIKHNDMAFTTIVSAIPLVCYYIGMSMIFSGGSRDDNGAGAIIGIIAMVAYFVGQLLVLFLSRVREYYADEGSVNLGCRPEHLASALYKLVYGAAAAPQEEIKDIEGSKAFFVTNVTDAQKELKSLYELDLNHDGSIDFEELELLKEGKVNIDSRSKIMELLSTHPDMVKRIKKLSELM